MAEKQLSEMSVRELAVGIHNAGYDMRMHEVDGSGELRRLAYDRSVAMTVELERRTEQAKPIPEGLVQAAKNARETLVLLSVMRDRGVANSHAWSETLHANVTELGLALKAAPSPSIPEGHVGLPDGRVVKVLGTLPMTADGCVAGVDAKVWTPGGAEWSVCVRDYAHQPGAIDDDPNMALADCYSSESAARDAGKGVGDGKQ